MFDRIFEVVKYIMKFRKLDFSYDLFSIKIEKYMRLREK